MPSPAQHYAAEVETFMRTQRRRRGRPTHRDREEGGMPPLLAAAVAGGAVALAAVVGRRYSPDRSHPDIDRWYHRDLDKPSFTPPDAVFGAVWPVLDLFLAFGGYRLLTAPKGPERDAAIALWAVNVAMVGGWSKIFFGERNLGGGALGAAAMLGTGAAYVECASHVDSLAAASGVPFAAWVAFASVLSEEVWRRNA
jgi:tryptophan-rich sensory protein